MSQAPRVSVIMNCLNSERYLGEAIDSVYAQTYANWEIVFLDNASTDGSAEIAKSYDSRLRYIRRPTTVSLGLARNEAVNNARGELVAFLDCDDSWLPPKLERQVHLLDARPELALAYSDSEVIEADGRLRCLDSQLTRFCRGWVFDVLLDHNFIPLHTVLVRRAVLLEAGPFEDYQIMEDYDMWLRVAAAYRVDYIDEPLARFRVHPQQWSRKHELALVEAVSMFERWEASPLALQPGRRRALRKARALAYYNAANATLALENDKPKAREHLRHALSEIMLPRALALYGLTFVGLSSLTRIRQWRRWKRRAQAHATPRVSAP